MSSFQRSRRLLKFFLAGLAVFLFLFGFPHHASRTFRKDTEELEEPLQEKTTSGGQPPPHEALEPVSAKFTSSALPEKKPNLPLGKHKFRPDGLLDVNQDGAHPIYELISRAESEWEAKLERASKTLDEAVAEYRRRYSRPPPKGFDLWWKYVQENNVQLPDEYDRIYHDLEPFWGLEPYDLIQIQAELELKKDSYTIGKNETDDEVQVLTWAFQDGKYNQLIAGSREVIKLFKPIQELLPTFRMTLSPHDGPNRLSDYGVKSAVLEAAASQTYVERAALPRMNSIGWVSACSPNSPARRKPINLDSPPPRPSKKTFIWDHVQTMDPCNHPDHLFHHGQFLSHNMGPTPQSVMVPEFSYCSTTIHHNIRIPTPYGWTEDIYPRVDDPEWDVKVDERLLWRGSITGMYHSRTSRWRHSHREFLVGFTNEIEGTIQALPPNRTRSERLGGLREIRKARINPAVMDIAFAGDPHSCDPEICDLLLDVFPWRGRQSIKEAGNYKYVIDVDGNGWSGRFKRLITSNALIFKSTIYPEWFADRIMPWLHYVPIQIDLSDLHDALLFFRGDGNGEGAHENLARKIAVGGRQWSKTFWRKEDLTAYFFRLTLEYARLMSTDRESMSYH
ncbi:glycosyl transferase family 90-domain-containing protein [Gymnopilus junonius]|uniref:Glycosyl transferase family 90-domain-containing protein n=1 Tax=Gymnopilus junonius TaxID=109634 RepID=A0A9P5NTN7_GYMJU|nr:glycosyl transferase family 90-domain-containing protein [Gymnopilus junonius]